MRKKQFTSFDVAGVVRELREAVLDSRVSNVYQLDGKTLLFKLRTTDKPVLFLVLEAGRRFNLTSYSVEKPNVPPAFCMALRKHLRNCWLTDVEQHEFERVVTFTFKTKAGVIQLFLELFGDGNIILVGDEGEVLQALIYKRMRDRNIIRGEVFRFAPPSGKNPVRISKEELSDELQNFGDVEFVRALTRFLGIGGFYAEEVLLRAGVDKKKPCDMLDDSMVDAVFEKLQRLLSQVINGDLEPCVVSDEAGDLVDVAPVKLRRYAGFKHQPYASFNEALDEFYARGGAIERALVMAFGDVKELKQEAARFKRMIASQEKLLTEAEAGADKARGIGDLIYLHSGELQVLLDKFSAGKESGKGWSKVVSEVLVEKEAGLTPCIFFESFDTKHLVVNLCVDGLCFGLDLRKDLFANAALFYERGKRARRKLKGGQVALKESKKRLEEVDAKIGEAEALARVRPTKTIEELATRKIKRKEWFEKFRWFVSSDGFLVVAGKDAVSNEVLVKKYTEDGDVVFHADVFGAPFVVVKTKGEKPSEQCLREASEFAAAFSRGWREGFASVDVYFVKPKQLSKHGGSGEYVPRGAFVVRGKRNWLRGVPLKLAVGTVIEDDEVGFVGGPIDAVKTKTNAYVVVVPGDLKGKPLFKRVLKALAANLAKETRKQILKASVEDFRKFIPFGKGRILEG